MTAKMRQQNNDKARAGKKCSKIAEEVNINNKKIFKYVRNRGSVKEMW